MKRLNGWDAMMLYSETDSVPTHTLKIGIIDVREFPGDFTFELFKHVVGRRLHLLEPLRYRLVDMPFRLHHPMWLEGVEVDLDYHVRRASVAHPGGRRELDAAIGTIASGQLDRSKPLWEMYFVEGLADGRLAVVTKVHHSLADGVASANLIARALDPRYGAHDQVAPNNVAPMPTRADLLRAARRDHLRQASQLPRLLSRTARGVARLQQRAKERGPQVDLASGLTAPKTFLNHTVSPGRRFASAALALADVKEISRHLGVTINDVVLAMAAGALRDLLLRYDGGADRPLIASVPTSLDTSPDRLAGNELSAMNLSLPVHIEDPIQRVRVTSLATRHAKEDAQLLGHDVLQSWVGYLPPLSPPIYRWRSRKEPRRKLSNIVVSNVPGPRERASLGGATLSEIYSVGMLLAGTAMNVTVWSYVDQLNISVLTDDRTLGDAHEATEAMVKAFIDIRKAAGLSTQLTPVETAIDEAVSG